MTKISVILGTARESYGVMLGRKEIHLLQPTLDSFKAQTFTDFEFILSDALYEKREKLFCGEPFNRDDFKFTIKHIPVKPFSIWLQKGLWALQAGFNQGIVHSDGELLLFFGDCCEFKSDTLELFWKWYKKGYFPMALTYYHKDGKPLFEDDVCAERGLMTLEEIKRAGCFDSLKKDSRWGTVAAQPNCVKTSAPWEWYYGYSSVSLEAALKINGYDEYFDGDKALGDVEFGSRLELAGYKNLLLDENLYVIENRHTRVSPSGLFSNSSTFKSNYSLLLLNRKKRLWHANSYKLTQEEIECIAEHGTRWSIPRPKEGTVEYELFRLWANDPPNFDIAERRRKR